MLYGTIHVKYPEYAIECGTEFDDGLCYIRERRVRNNSIFFWSEQLEKWSCLLLKPGELKEE